MGKENGERKGGLRYEMDKGDEERESGNCFKVKEWEKEGDEKCRWDGQMKEIRKEYRGGKEIMRNQMDKGKEERICGNCFNLKESVERREE
jgi:hypothetical protein